jgi:HTH-type transcriptional regulator, quorum sensing regulator NprR
MPRRRALLRSSDRAAYYDVTWRALGGPGGGIVVKTTTIEAAPGLGERVRTLRKAAGMTQDGLADGRFTKQYVSQIERGEIIPSGELLDWLASRLGVETLVLRTGLSSGDLERIDDELASGNRLLDEHRYAEALEAFRSLRGSLAPGTPRAVARSMTGGETWALIRLGRLGEAADLLGEARAAAQGPDGSKLEQAEVAYLTAVCCTMLSQMTAAQVEFGRALDLLDASAEQDDRLRLDIHQWRSRCHRRQRDLDAAREDIDRALELSEAINDVRRRAEVHLQASLVAERLGRWALARRYAETSRDLYAEIGDVVTRGRVINNIAGINHELGDDSTAIAQLREAFGIFVEASLEAEAGYVLSSLAEIHRGQGDLEEAESVARRALELLEGRIDHVQEIGTARLVLARAHLEQGDLEGAERLLADVDESYASAESVSHQARSWMTRGELELLRKNEAEAARLYREAAVALQPIDP